MLNYSGQFASKKLVKFFEMIRDAISFQFKKNLNHIFEISTSESKQNLAPLSNIEIKQYVDHRRIEKNYEVHAYLIQIMILPFFVTPHFMANCFIFICIISDLCFIRRLKMNFDLIEYKNSNNSFGMPETMLSKKVDTLLEFQVIRNYREWVSMGASIARTR